MTMEDFYGVVGECGLPRFSAKQIADWVYKKRITSIDEMTNLSVANRALLSEKYDIGRYNPLEFQQSVDGTVKYLFKTDRKSVV